MKGKVMNKQRSALLATFEIQPEAKVLLIGEVRHTLALGVLALLILLLPCSLLAGPIILKISDLANSPPEVEVDGAPYGYDFCTCADLGIIDPANEDGGVITLFGVDRNGSLTPASAVGASWTRSCPSPRVPVRSILSGSNTTTTGLSTMGI